MHQSVYLVGAGGHAKVVIATLEAIGIIPDAIFDDDSSKWGSSIFNIPIKGGLGDFEALGEVSAVVAIGNNAKRKQVVERFNNVDWLTITHPSSYIHSSVRVGRGTIIQFGCVLEPDVIVGQHCILNSNSMIGHDCILEDYVHSSGGKVAGNVRLCEGVMLGGNTSVHPGITIGAWSKSAAGSAIMRDVLPYSVVIGNPARAMKTEEFSKHT